MYEGTVEGTKGSWLGVEWDDPSRGKHDGTHAGTSYFTARGPSSASFIREAKANFGKSFMRCVVEKRSVSRNLTFLIIDFTENPI